VLIELRDVSKRYDAIEALSSVTAAIDGRVIGLLGPNGSGKSTLLKCLLGLIPFAGHAEVLGLSPHASAFSIRDRVGYMPEMDSYLPDMNAVELCAYAAELSGLPRSEAMQRAHAALYYAGLEDKRYLKVEGYSTGLKQRVKLAQALVHDPDLLFLDEPTNGLDPKARDEMLELIAELPGRRDCAIVLSTHLLRDVERVCDHAVILHRGRLRFCGAIDGMRAGQGSGRVVEVEVKAGGDALAAALERAGCQVAVQSVVHLTVTLPSAESAAGPESAESTRFLFARARDAGVQIRRLEAQRESLEAAFLRTVGETS
jgi:ABC-2 type transport system ATP-binding protein